MLLRLAPLVSSAPWRSWKIPIAGTSQLATHDDTGGYRRRKPVAGNKSWLLGFYAPHRIILRIYETMWDSSTAKTRPQVYQKSVGINHQNWIMGLGFPDYKSQPSDIFRHVFRHSIWHHFFSHMFFDILSGSIWCIFRGSLWLRSSGGGAGGGGIADTKSHNSPLTGGEKTKPLAIDSNCWIRKKNREKEGNSWEKHGEEKMKGRETNGRSVWPKLFDPTAFPHSSAVPGVPGVSCPSFNFFSAWWLENLIGILWKSMEIYGNPMEILWKSYGNPMGILWKSCKHVKKVGKPYNWCFNGKSSNQVTEWWVFFRQAWLITSGYPKKGGWVFTS